MAKLERLRSRNHRFQMPTDKDLPEHTLENRYAFQEMNRMQPSLGPIMCTLKAEVSSTSSKTAVPVFPILATQNKTSREYRTRVGRQLGFL